MATPGRRLNEIVTAGTWPAWFTDSGPRLAVSFATAPSGTREPVAERTYSMLSADRSRWYWGASSMMTQYSLLGVKMVETCADPYASYRAVSIWAAVTPSV